MRNDLHQEFAKWFHIEKKGWTWRRSESLDSFTCSQKNTPVFTKDVFCTPHSRAIRSAALPVSVDEAYKEWYLNLEHNGDLSDIMQSEMRTKLKQDELHSHVRLERDTDTPSGIRDTKLYLICIKANIILHPCTEEIYPNVSRLNFLYFLYWWVWLVYVKLW